MPAAGHGVSGLGVKLPAMCPGIGIGVQQLLALFLLLPLLSSAQSTATCAAALGGVHLPSLAYSSSPHSLPPPTPVIPRTCSPFSTCLHSSLNLKLTLSRNSATRTRRDNHHPNRRHRLLCRNNLRQRQLHLHNLHRPRNPDRPSRSHRWHNYYYQSHTHVHRRCDIGCRQKCCNCIHFGCTRWIIA